jgi:hypothetical protein
MIYNFVVKAARSSGPEDAVHKHFFCLSLWKASPRSFIDNRFKIL